MNEDSVVAEPGDLLAHAPQVPGREWHLLSDHSGAVSRLTAGFLGTVIDTQWGRLAGQWHDLGKGAPEWQAFIRAAGEAASAAHLEEADGKKHHGPPHSATGALHSIGMLGREHGVALAFAIAGHHGGLPDRERLRERLADPEERKRLTRAITSLGCDPADVVKPVLPTWLQPPRSAEQCSRSAELFIRLLFSALTDADFLDTEDYFGRAGDDDAKERQAARSCRWPGIASYLPALEAFMAKKQASARPTPVNRLRAEVGAACQTASAEPRGAFSLTVPTGGGKTLAGLTFALGHAVRHNLRRVVFALPFTSIIEQTCGVMREVFATLGPEVVLEHHSAVEQEKVTALGRVAAENWDAPLIVTTQVQLFESLFANRPGACRKLHNLIDSVLVLDEVQSLPANLLEPILDVLDDLVSHYGVTVLLMTATQPALHQRTLGAGQFPGLTERPREVIPPDLSLRLWEGLRRVEVHWPTDLDVARTERTDDFWQSLTEELTDHDQVLAITHLKKDAQALWQAVARLDGEVLHLSAAMCPAHRSQVLKTVKERLNAGRKCRLVSTQVVEAGVDIDFPVVFRAMAGLESLAQSAGRCNREGSLPTGHFFVYRAPTQPPKSLRLHQDVAQTMLDGTPELDIFVPGTFKDYFDRLYSCRDLDLHRVQPLRASLRFQETAETFRMIEQASNTVFVPLDDTAREALRALRFAGPSRDRLRALQRCGVSVYPDQFKSLQAESAVEEIHPGLWALCSDLHYDKRLGLRTAADASTALIL
jgi:CRISPR-associated endonuclease/helicase Cas3